mgnify:CR=1 FL=1
MKGCTDAAYRILSLLPRPSKSPARLLAHTISLGIRQLTVTAEHPRENEVKRISADVTPDGSVAWLSDRSSVFKREKKFTANDSRARL